VCLASSTSGPTSFGYGLHVYRFIYSGEVCGRYADDARLIRASVTAPTSVVGFSFQTPQFSDHLDQWATFLPGEQGLHFDINPAFWHHTNYHST
jgi:hypothetical protein